MAGDLGAVFSLGVGKKSCDIPSMDLAASAAISVVNKVIVALQNVKWNKHQCTRLAEQWLRLETALTNARRGLGPSHINALRATEALGIATIEFIAKYANKGFLGRLWKVTSDKETIEDLCHRLSSLLQELQLGISVDMNVFLRELREDHVLDVKEIHQLLAGQARLVDGQEEILRRLDDFIPGQEKLIDGQAEIKRQLAQMLLMQQQQHRQSMAAGQQHGQYMAVDAQAEILRKLKDVQEAASRAQQQEAGLFAEARDGQVEMLKQLAQVMHLQQQNPLPWQQQQGQVKLMGLQREILQKLDALSLQGEASLDLSAHSQHTGAPEGPSAPATTQTLPAKMPVVRVPTVKAPPVPSTARVERHSQKSARFLFCCTT